MRTVIVHDEWGIYLGSFMGLGFWSMLDCAGQTSACTFDGEADARDFVSTWAENSTPDSYRYVPVTEQAWAEIADLDAAGLASFTQPMKDEVLRNSPAEGHAYG